VDNTDGPHEWKTRLETLTIFWKEQYKN